MNIWSILTNLVKPISDLVDEVHTSDEERLKIKSHIFEVQNTVAERFMDYEARLVEAKSKVIAAEAQGSSWLQRTWRAHYDADLLSFGRSRYVRADGV